MTRLILSSTVAVIGVCVILLVAYTFCWPGGLKLAGLARP